jgi:hypothetical protein
MDDVERFIDDLNRLFAGNQDMDDMRIAARRALAAFIGRAAVREHEYAPPAEVHRILSEGRSRLRDLTFEGHARYLRVDLLTELDKAINEVRPRS